ncbi:MAG: hypothetical protein U5L95_02735 [Candidatus Saccharibacteria bacterium]|nr:hypothetical protein [Candidatus Saccharibacteria bacterium]
MSSFKRLGLIIVSFALVFSVSNARVFSQEQPARGTGGSGLSISPTRFELSILPGNDDTVQISVQNVTGSTIEATPVINDFVSDNDTGQPRLLINEERDDLPSIKPFFNELESMRIEAGETETKEIPVEIPENTPAGGYYGVIRFLASPEGTAAPDDGQVALTASLAPVVLITVPGDITEQVQFRNILYYRNDASGTFFTSKPEQVGLQIVNQGNGFVQPFGQVSVKDMFGEEVHSYELNDTDPKGNIIPRSTRVFRDDLPDIGTPGRYTTTANVSYGNGGEVLTLSKSFWYLPYWFLAILAVGLGALVYGGFLVKRRVNTGSYKKPKTRK